ncbi:MAG TPA: hypothetical protein VFF52_23970, partial [Isosphaeraceae bacterium]|nr:hypothetical protein [Isosphaeraceae bacterium]
LRATWVPLPLRLGTAAQSDIRAAPECAGGHGGSSCKARAAPRPAPRRRVWDGHSRVEGT